MDATRANLKEKIRLQLRVQRQERYVEHNLLHLLKNPEISKANVVASYASFGNEPSTVELNLALIAAGKTLLLPRIAGKNLEWVQWHGGSENLLNNGKIDEPVGETWNELDAIDLVLVPALAIDPDGYRLGQGGGYYDRALPTLRAWRHGVVFNFEKMEHDLPRDPWDIPVNSW